MTNMKRRHYSKEEKRQAKIRGKVCQQVTKCSLEYGTKKGLFRERLLKELRTRILFLQVGEDRVRDKKKMLIAVTLMTSEHLHRQSPRKKYIVVVDAVNAKEYRISYRQHIKILSPEIYNKKGETWRRKGIPNGKVENYTQKRKKEGTKK